MKRMLIVEDDENLSRGIAFAFEKDGYFVIQQNTMNAGRVSYEQDSFDIVILDLGLPPSKRYDRHKAGRSR